MALIEKYNYIPNALRKNRTEAFEIDIEKVFVRFNESLKTAAVDQISMTDFSLIWYAENMQFIYQCLCYEESYEEFAQLMYEIVLKKYFRFKDKNSKIFSLFSLYFLYYACEYRKRINISVDYIEELKNFLLDNRNDNHSHYMKVAYELHQKCFNLCTKVGLRNPIVRCNGEVPRKPPLVKTDHLLITELIEEELKYGKNEPSLLTNLYNYEKLKGETFKDASYNKEKFPLDVHFPMRVNKLLKNYKYFVVDKFRKKEEED